MKMSLVNSLKRSSVAHLLLAVNFFISGLAINILQALLYVSLYKFSRHWYRIINQYLCYSLNCQFVFLAEWWSPSETILYIDKESLKKYYNKEHGCLIMNHSYEIDWLMGFLLCERIGILGNCKCYAKKSIQFIPTVGWTWKFAESVFLERNWDKDKEIIGRQITELANHPTPISLLLFAEGTRFTKEKHEASLKYAEEHNLPRLQHLLSPRVKGFITSIPYMRNKFGAIYDVTLCVKESHPVAPTITSLLKAKYVEAHMYMQRIPLDEVPLDDEGASKWLHDLYIKKDKMIDSFKKTGSFFENSGVPPLEPFTLKRRWYSLLNSVGWALITLPSVCYVLISLLFSGSLFYFCIGVLLVAAISYLFYLLIGLTKITKSSSYGKVLQNSNGTTKVSKTE
ncbi:1-acyl-sn-glycerol-3-phosphate acyltransferase gamma [Frankliniella occidentalis]|uniref:1-acyl-sn-glycerol-3-phosphate acyltransferase gamma n=1 Tax=Frankliniella occidentalis TaxID=133901 RepID=A0A6J1TJM3_FRAOC|nr:1-acyl-sn-glycerol-3-phosphate acyltransferase gamma [Frankliniella occidentalis]XP_026293501.1 1-acyl-sn-glycerol-3-phosphate acyltransferase gamma [Frankliniella occidentalis]XP_026293502.1 1-acyl-sn-glycerol-3-phosphate acyltransferase gamma [Frankliniella occidentalis]XP_026293503.1 1-acyl-sn-glycerol-3-phosphate acyltransferase gamma [Frankliniella occidentalis]XP_026293504.1 1-acyl-sn-glycerol-3-phosphate acyltransferase gamma [Frankliniella occidentalis]